MSLSKEQFKERYTATNCWVSTKKKLKDYQLILSNKRGVVVSSCEALEILVTEALKAEGIEERIQQ